jgi:hypothetical protein
MFTPIFGHVRWMRILKTKKFNLKTKSKKINWVDFFYSISLKLVSQM